MCDACDAGWNLQKTSRRNQCMPVRLQTVILPCCSHRGPACRLRPALAMPQQLGPPSRGPAVPPLVAAAALSAVVLWDVAASTRP